MISARGHEYPTLDVSVVAFDQELWKLFPPRANSFAAVDWPSPQVKYLGLYLEKLGCKTVVIESHYIDRDYIADMALLYARSLRSYPNFTQRIHFFRELFDKAAWEQLVRSANGGRFEDARKAISAKGYLGYSSIRPLPSTPIGRTVLATWGEKTQKGETRLFGGVRDYTINLAGFELTLPGLAFQQQDRGVSACATTALWSAIHRVAPLEGLALPTPADITQGASRYLLAEGRSLPSEGLTIQQICEATRGAGLSPVVVKGMAPDSARAQLLGHIQSGIAPVLVIGKLGKWGHAVCGVGVKLGDVKPQTNPKLHFRDRATSVHGVYAHDDRLGPYASVDLEPDTRPDGSIGTRVIIKWPDKGVREVSDLLAIVVPLPPKIRLPLTSLRTMGLFLAEAFGMAFPELNGELTLDCRYTTAPEYREAVYSFGLTDDGAYRAAVQTILSRYVGVVGLSAPTGPLLDVLVDATETPANPAVLGVVKRSALTAAQQATATVVAKNLGTTLIV